MPAPQLKLKVPEIKATSEDSSVKESASPAISKLPSAGNAVPAGTVPLPQSNKPATVGVSVTSSSIVVEGPEDMINIERVWRILNFGKPGTGKTHLGLDMPAPVIVLDTENRVHLISKKFKTCKDCGKEWNTALLMCPRCKSKNIGPKDIRRIATRTMGDLYNAVEYALAILEEERKNTGRTGTIMLDSFTEAWVQAQDEHIKKFYSTSDPSQVKLSPRDDYKHINPRHNDLRKRVLDSGFNVYFTATEGDVYGKGDQQFDIVGVKAEGQKHNPYSVDWWIHSFWLNGVLTTTFEKNSITAKDNKTYTNFSFDQLCNIADRLETQEKMLTSSVLAEVESAMKVAETVVKQEPTEEPPAPTPTPEPKPDETKKEEPKPEIKEEKPQ